MNIQFLPKWVGTLAILLLPLLSLAQARATTTLPQGSPVVAVPNQELPMAERILRDPQAYENHKLMMEAEKVQQVVQEQQAAQALQAAQVKSTVAPVIETPVVVRQKGTISRQDLMKCRPERQQYVLAHPEEFQVID